MAKRVIAEIKKTEKKAGSEKIIEKQTRQTRILEKLGFVQMVFDFYSAPVT